jgi:hypothetical protein
LVTISGYDDLKRKMEGAKSLLEYLWRKGGSGNG